MKVLTSLILVVLLTSLSCRSVSQPVTTNHADEEAQQYLEHRVINAVKKWYGTQDVRVVVESRSPARWKLQVGPEMKEATVEIDTATLEVVRIWPGY